MLHGIGNSYLVIEKLNANVQGNERSREISGRGMELSGVLGFRIDDES